MFSRNHKQPDNSDPSFIWTMQSVHINKPIYIKNIQDARKKRGNGKHYVPWLSLVAIKI
jgi:hypothetical protein